MRELTDVENADNVIYDEDDQNVQAKNVQKQVEEQEYKKYGVLLGVFVPTLLTILGVILYLRVGWVVGNAGLFGAFLIISLSFLITACTALSMSSFVTNTRVGAGGAFSIVSQALGLEVGGSIGIPLYISQAIVVAMYIFGFRAGWQWVFPNHLPLLVDLSVFILIIGIALVSTSFAFRIQGVIVLFIFASLAAIFIGGLSASEHQIEWWGDFRGSAENQFSGISFWGVFAVFFPAATGIMAGANMSGELKDPRKAIPIGTLSAIALSYVIYIWLAWWLTRIASTENLIENYTIAIDKAIWSPIVLGGLLAATFSSALASFIGAPRILQALGSHQILPGGKWLAARSKNGEPKNAIYVTIGLVFLSLMMRDLNTIAPMITMTFLITYSMINLVVLLEKHLQLISFRPSFSIPKWVALTGLLGCLFAMFIINPTFGMLACGFIVITYIILLKRQLKAPFSDVRSGLFTAFAEWAAKKIKFMHGKSERAWKPNILLPVEDISRLHGIFRIVHEMVKPIGSVNLLGIKKKSEIKDFEQRLENISMAYMEKGVFSSFSVIEENNFSDGVIKGLQALGGSFFRPNILCLELPKDKKLHRKLWQVADAATNSNMGIALIVDHPTAGLGSQSRVNLWIPELENWEVHMNFENLDLELLLGFSLYQSWKGELRIFVQVSSNRKKKEAEKFVERLVNLARIPADEVEIFVEKSLLKAVREAPHGDVNFFPLQKHEMKQLWDLRDAAESTCLFCKDSGSESAMA